MFDIEERIEQRQVASNMREPITHLKDRLSLPKDIQVYCDWLCICDEITDRLRQVFKERDMNVQEFSKLHGGSYWYIPAYGRKPYSDGSYDVIPKDKLTAFLTSPTLHIPEKQAFRHLEWRLGYQPNQICTCFDETVGVQGFLFGTGFINQNGTCTSKYHNSPRIKAYFAMKQAQQKDLQKRMKEYQALQKKNAEAKKKAGTDKLSRFKRKAMGMFYKPDADTKINLTPIETNADAELGSDGILYTEEA